MNSGENDSDGLFYGGLDKSHVYSRNLAWTMEMLFQYKDPEAMKVVSTTAMV